MTNPNQNLELLASAAVAVQSAPPSSSNPSSSSTAQSNQPLASTSTSSASNPLPTSVKQESQQQIQTDAMDVDHQQPQPQQQEQQVVKRVIDESTDLSTLTDAEIAELTLNMKNEDEVRPLISSPVPISVLKSEYENGSQNVLKKIVWLEKNGWDMVWRARGDGDCFYRSFALAYILRILQLPDPRTEANIAFSRIEMAKGLLGEVGFDMGLCSDFLEDLTNILARIADSSKEMMTEYMLIEVLQSQEKSQSIVVILRLFTSAYIRSNPTHFEPFLIHPETFMPLSVTDFVTSEVEPCGKDADQVQIQALSKCLGMGLRVCYLDGSDVGGGGGGEGEEVVNWVDFEWEDGKGVGEKPLVMLYRPGHYDVLASDAESRKGLI